MVPVTVSCPDISADNIIVSPTAIPIEIEGRETKDFMIAVNYGDTTPGAGYEVGKIYANPEKVSVSGPESIVDKIDRVVANVSVEGMTADSTKKASLVLYDKNQEIMSDKDTQYLTFDIGTTSVDVNVELWNTVSGVTFTGEPYGSPASGYVVADIITTPNEISLAGTKEALDKLAANGNTVEIPSKLLKISGANSTVECKIDLDDILPEGTKAVSNQAESIIVEVEVIPLGSKQLSIPTQDIQVSDISEGLQAVFADTSITVTLQGKAADLQQLTASSVTASVSVKNMTEGTYEIPVSIQLPDGVSLLSEVKASVQLVSLQTKISAAE